MGKGETPARVRAVLLPPRPAPREPVVDRTQLRAREESSEPAPVRTGSLPVEQRLGQPLVAAAMAAAPSAGGRAPDHALPPVAPKPLDPAAQQPVSLQPVSLQPVSLQPVSLQPVSLQPVPRHLLECRVSVIPRLPVVNLEKPSSNWPDLTPSPVPRVSLVPPTGRIDPSDLLSAAAARNLPTVAPRTRAFEPRAPAPALTAPRLSKPAPRGWLTRRIARDLRSSKREIAFGLGIGIGISLVLGKLGQSYLESRGGGRAALESWTGSALPSPEPRPVPSVVGPSVPAPPVPAPAPAPPVPAPPVPSNTGDPSAPDTSAPAVAPALLAGAAAVAAAAVAAAPSGLTASLPSAVALQLSAAPFGPAARQVRAAPPKPRSTRAVRRPSQASETEPSGADEPAVDELESHGKAPLSPSESAGLGRELPL